ncbi:hypothetical protein MMC26_005726 [Xylographa opegraphella]|nr:hypothetical protein [Xylographa opegraphella]
MSYNAYNYSPYYQQQAQQPVTGNGNGQPELGNSNISYYRPLADVPSQRTHNGPATYPAITTPEHYSTNYAYPSYRSTAATREETAQQTTKTAANSTSSYYDTTSQSYTDTSALGSLAYASALGRDGKSTEQNQNNVTQHQPPIYPSASQVPYGSNVTAANGYSEARSDSRGSSNTRRNSGLNHTPIGSPSAASIAANALAQTQQLSRVSSPHYHQKPGQYSNRQSLATTQHSGYSPSNPGQSYTVGLQDPSSVNSANTISLPPVQSSKSRESPGSSKPPYRPLPPAAYPVALTAAGDASYHADTTSYQTVPATQQKKGPVTFSTSAEPPYSTQSHSRSSSTSNVPREDQHQMSSRQFISTNKGPSQLSNNQSESSNSNTGPEIENHPITVDPNQVFNVYEFQRRKAEAEAEAAKKVTDQRSLQDRPATLSSANGKQAASASAPAFGAVGATVGANTKQSSAKPGSKEKIEAEIKAMIEKMREYKAKDPAVFSEVWERFKQVQPPPGASPQSLHTAREPQATTSTSRQDREIASPSIMDNGILPSPSPVLAQYPNIPGNETGNLPDLGRFPYQRRRRSRMTDKAKPNESRMSDVVNAEDFGSSRLDNSVIDPRLSASSTSAVMQTGSQEKVATDMPPLEKTAYQNIQSLQGGRDPNAATSTTSYSSPYVVSTSKPGSGTIWPEHNKTALAIVGKNILESTAVNVGKRISVDDIRSMLDQDPSYDQLCQTLESRGFVFERADFARRLLNAVPHTKIDSQTPITTPRPVKKPRRKPASDSPPRPRGRPRKDGLPPRQTLVVQNEINGQTPTASSSYPNGYMPASYVTTSGPGNHQVPTSTQNSSDQLLASVLQTAITQIDNQSFGSALNDRPVANTGRPSTNIARPPYAIDGNKGGSSTYSAGDAARDALKWSATRQYGPETFKKDNNKSAQPGQISRAMPPPSPVVKVSHPRFGTLNVFGSQVNVGQIAQDSNTQASGATDVSTPNILTKEQMARKRNFSEIVDLTQDIDDEVANEHKRVQLSKPGSLTTDQGASSSAIRSHAYPAQLTAPEPMMTVQIAPATIQNGTPSNSCTSVTANNARIDLSQFKAPNAGIISSREALRLGDVVQELNKNDALKRSVYNVKTLARDILISKGIHPTERPLNWHLNSLRGNFHNVTSTSDLSTFRWDLVDPGGPKMSHVVREAETKAQDADDEAMTPSSVPTYTPTRGRPRGRPRSHRGAVRGNPSSVRSLDRFRHDVTSLVRDMRPSRGDRGSLSRGTSHLHTSTTRQSRTPNFIDMADGTIPSHMSPPPRPKESSVTGSSGLQSSLSVLVDNGSANNRHQPESDGSADAPTARAAESTVGTSLVVRVPGLTSALEQSRSTTPRPRGRPPGSANKSSTADTGPKKSGRPVGSGTPSRGRPSGRGPSISYRTEVPEDGIGILVPSRSPSASSHLSHVETIPEVEKRKKGRKSRQAVTPRFQVFRCQWQGCGSELHNLETLRKHIYKLHGKAESSEVEASAEAAQKKIPCLWIGCEQEGVFSSTTGIMKFEDRDSWKAHVERGHLATVAWELGDGPSTHPSDVEPSSYLSDSQGRTVTPLARTTGPPDPLPPGSGRSPTRAYHRAHGNVTEHQKSQAELNSQVATKQVAGVFIGRGTKEPETPQVEQESGEEESDSDHSSSS